MWASETAPDLFADAPQVPDAGEAAAPLAARVPPEFPALADALIAHSDAGRYALAYRLLWRLTHGEPRLLEHETDADVLRARSLEKAVRRDLHKMKAFVRFREVRDDDGEPAYLAWFEPDHYIVERVAPFFVRRFTAMRWSILTPYRCAHWDGETLRFSDGARRADAPDDDAHEHYWRTYYASIFNPARLKTRAMVKEMPVRYWKNLPEAQLIPGLVRDANLLAQDMIRRAPTTPRRRIAAPAPAATPQADSLDALRAQARQCRRCPLWEPATQTVFGQGPSRAELMLVGEQPGDREDLAGTPFVGPAGQLLDRALRDAGLDREALYVTNVVKHFKFEPRGKQRLHKRADGDEQAACRPWLEQEIALVRPRLIVCLGALAAQNLIDARFRLLAERGQWRDGPAGTRIMATVHPSYLLRLPDTHAREQALAAFTADLKRAADALHGLR